ncbi:MAG: S46 family peptidase [Sphingobacteriales bacterium]|nr:MAG: S46 family peptidase [Sphingobacteriales bacterium]
MKRFLVLFSSLLLGCIFQVSAREGMWLPPLLSGQAAAMRSAGLQIPVSELYNERGTGLNEAVVRFGGGCTGELISGNGLLLTNHHCGYGTVQGLSSAANDYFARGFWAMKPGEEIPCPGLTVAIVRRMENVTDVILNGLPDALPETTRDSIISQRIRNLEASYRNSNLGLEPSVSAYYNGNQYWVSLMEVFRDIRLVGFPPNGIGQFGGDADNWMWPRHTGDFSMFRVYAGADNKPADYNRSNKPFKPRRFLTLNAKGVKEGDFTMVYGFPGATQEYLAATQIAQIADITDPIRIEARSARLAAWTQHMQANRNVFLQYTSKRAGVANGWKKWQGEVQGLKAANVVAKRRETENRFQYWTQSDTSLPYADDVLSRINANINEANRVLPAEIYFQEAVLGVELIARGAVLDRMATALQTTDPAKELQKAVAGWEGFYKNYDSGTDQAVFDKLMPLFFSRVPEAFIPDVFRSQLARYHGNFREWSAELYSQSIAAGRNRFEAFLKEATPASLSQLQADPALQLYRAAMQTRRTAIAPVLAAAQQRLTTLSRLHRKAQIAADSAAIAYPDANSTLRLAYGQVKGIDPDGPAPYSYQTFLSEAIAKDNPQVAEFQVPQKLKTLYASRDFGRWGNKTNVPVAFIADNHTTGGNSGSPVLNTKGELIGTNFDRIWEGTMSDLYFDPSRSRNISLDIRYTLFVIEKFGGAGWLLNEMKIVR